MWQTEMPVCFQHAATLIQEKEEEVCSQHLLQCRDTLAYLLTEAINLSFYYVGAT